MTEQQGICEECNKQYAYVFNPKYPRKYCPPCSAAKQAAFKGVPPVPHAGTMPTDADGRVYPGIEVQKIPLKPKANGTSFYTAYAKDIFVAMHEKGKPLDAAIDMDVAITLVKQAKEAFE